MLTINGHDYSHYDIHYYSETGTLIGKKAHYTRPPMATSDAAHLKADAMKVSENLPLFHYDDKDGHHSEKAYFGIANFAGLYVHFQIKRAF